MASNSEEEKRGARQPEYGQPQYGQPQYGQPAYGQPEGYYRPPPPPATEHQVPPHTNQAPISDYNIPSYDPSHPQFAPPPETEGIYDQEPIQGQHSHHNAPAKPAFGDRLSAIGLKAAAPLNTLANKLGSESFLPAPMDKECDKAARILRSFCKDGIYTDTEPLSSSQTAGGHTKHQPKSRTLLTIPSKVIARAVGLAIFTTGRVGFHVTGSTGSGVLIARLPDGSWSPPSGIQVYTLGAGFVIGADIYDCVVVINSKEALEAFTRTRLSLGSDLAVVAGPWGAGGSLDFAAPASEKGKAKGTASSPEQPHKVGATPAPVTQPQAAAQPGAVDTAGRPEPSKAQHKHSFRHGIKPVYSYVKSRGIYAGIQIDGTVITERTAANTVFYTAHVPVAKILKGEVPSGSWEKHVRPLLDVVRGAEGWRGHGQNADGQGQWANAAATEPALMPQTGSYAQTSGVGAYGGSQGGVNVAPVMTGMQQMHLGEDAPYNQPRAMTKEEEAAAEASAHGAQAPPPPDYVEHHPEVGTGPAVEHPPAYVDDGRVHPGIGDGKAPQQ